MGLNNLKFEYDTFDLDADFDVKKLIETENPNIDEFDFSNGITLSTNRKMKKD